MKRWKRIPIYILSLLSMLLLMATSTLSYAANDTSAAEEAGGTQEDEMTSANDPAETLGSSASEAALMLRYMNGMLTLPPGENTAKLTEALTLEALERLAETMFYEVLLPFEDELLGANLHIYDNVTQRQSIFQRMAEALNHCYAEFYNASLRIVCRDLLIMNIPLISTVRGRTALNWQEAASMYITFGQDMAFCMARGLLLDLALSPEGASFTCAVSDNEMLFFQGTRDQLYSARAALAYLYTVYTGTGERETYETPVLDPAYLATLTHPLPGCTIKNGWYNARDRQTRLHTGTDILANRGTNILSVTDGEVLYIGFSRLPGYYVIIRDSYGYEYHYYHMVEKSDFVQEGDTVESGQAIGLVGSTGNSAANHLHLAIVTPEGNYINPYDVFVQAGIGPIRPDN